MAILYSEARAGLQDIANNLAAVGQRITRVRQELDRVKAAMDALQAEHGTLVTEIDTEATNNPGTVWDDAKAQKDELVADFQALRARADAMIAAIDAL